MTDETVAYMGWSLSAQEQIDGFRREVRKLKAENAKLRELVKDIHTLATDYGVYVQYPYCDAWDEKLAVAEKQMCELGIEVDDG